MSQLFLKHQEKLLEAIKANQERRFYCAYPENEQAYDGALAKAAKAEFSALRNNRFDLGTPAESGYIASETSPYGSKLNIEYPCLDVKKTIERAASVYPQWARVPLDARTGVALEIIERLNAQSFVMAQATHHTTGQGLPMAFQAGGPHAQDRALEAVAIAYRELSTIPDVALWEKGEGKHAVRLRKQFHLRPRGIGLVIACATFPNWNSYAAIFANLMTGNATIIKPHPQAILPLALTVKTMRDTLAEFGFPADLVQLAVDHKDHPIAVDLAHHEAIGLIDFTGSSSFGAWLRENIRNKPIYTEEAGLNSIVIESTNQFKLMCRNIAFSLSLYSGQMCTSPQNIFIPEGGIETDEGHKSFDDIAREIGTAIDHLLSDPARAGHVCGALYSDTVKERIEKARGLGRIIRDSAALENKDARTATPLILALKQEDEAYLQEWFGPISFMISCKNADQCVYGATRTAARHGAITAALYSQNEAFIASVTDAYIQAGVALSLNLTGAIWVNQSAAFSDYHVSGANPAGNATLTDTAYVAGRFHTICIRAPLQ